MSNKRYLFMNLETGNQLENTIDGLMNDVYNAWEGERGEDLSNYINNYKQGKVSEEDVIRDISVMGWEVEEK